jgi:predicted membrane-bound spermidine synthase
MKKFSLEIVAFFCGAIVMAFEIVGSRMLGPYVGTSMFVWTSIIGVILFSLSIGYFWGGNIADRKPRAEILSLIIFISSLFMLAIAFVKDIFLEQLLSTAQNVEVSAIIASVVLFTIPSVLLGMVSPFAVRIKMKSLEKSGSTVGNLYAISTVGSIAGVFLSGFYLVPTFRITNILFLLAIVLIVVSLFLNTIYRFTKNKN